MNWKALTRRRASSTERPTGRSLIVACLSPSRHSIIQSSNHPVIQSSAHTSQNNARAAADAEVAAEAEAAAEAVHEADAAPAKLARID